MIMGLKIVEVMIVKNLPFVDSVPQKYPEKATNKESSKDEFRITKNGGDQARGDILPPLWKAWLAILH